MFLLLFLLLLALVFTIAMLLYIRYIKNNCIFRYNKDQAIQLGYLSKDVQWQNLIQGSMCLELRIPLCWLPFDSLFYVNI